MAPRPEAQCGGFLSSKVFTVRIASVTCILSAVQALHNEIVPTTAGNVVFTDLSPSQLKTATQRRPWSTCS